MVDTKRTDTPHCPYHEDVKRIQNKRDEDMEKMNENIERRLPTRFFFWAFGISFGILLSIQALNYEKLSNIQVSVACIMARGDERDRINKRQDEALKALSEEWGRKDRYESYRRGRDKNKD